LASPVSDQDFAPTTEPLWRYLDDVHPSLWRAGKIFPASGPALRQLLSDGEIDIAFSFDPASASAAIAQGLLPDTVRTFVLAHGLTANSHFVAIPKNAAQPMAAMAMANFLLSPEAQLKKQDPTGWGDFTVLSMDRLSTEDRAKFAAQPRGKATLSPAELGR